MTARQRKPPSRPRFEVYQDKKSEWRWRLVSRNGRIVAESGEGYVKRHAVFSAVGRVVSACSTAGLWPAYELPVKPKARKA